MDDLDSRSSWHDPIEQAIQFVKLLIPKDVEPHQSDEDPGSSTIDEPDHLQRAPLEIEAVSIP